MALTILGLSGALSHAPSAALYIDGKLIAAAEEERFVRDKHARHRTPYESAKFCLAQACIAANDVDIVSISLAPPNLFGNAARRHFAKRCWYAPGGALAVTLNDKRRFKQYRNKMRWCLEQLGFDLDKVRLETVAPHLAQASSAYHCSGFTEKTAIMGLGGIGEYATTFFGYGENGKIHKIKEFYDPDSLSGLYAALAEYLGFEMLDGETKVMDLATYGDAAKYDFSRLATFENGELIVDNEYVNVIGMRRYKEDRKGYAFSPKLVEWLGPRRKDDTVGEPYVHYAASMQALFEKLALQMMDYYLGDILRETGLIVSAGTGALNARLNQRILSRPDVREFFAQPASGDSGAAIGAASFISVRNGVPVEKMEHAFLGPAYSNEDIIAACARHPNKPQWEQLDNVTDEIAKVLAEGNPVAWFQGRMELGSQGLGGRSMLACPSAKGVIERINQQYRLNEQWRPFSYSMLDTEAVEMLANDHPAPFMAITFDMTSDRAKRLSALARLGGTVRAQVLKRGYNPQYYDLMKELEQMTGNGTVLNAALNRDGEPMVCSPTDALNLFFATGLQFLIMEDILVVKRAEAR